jgi:hypothetical protein
MKCRHCSTALTEKFLDLGSAPPSNAYLEHSSVNQSEMHFPLTVYVCQNCWLVQTEDFAKSDELFDDNYAYFSSTSQSWLVHAQNYCNDVTKRLSLSSESHVVEIASNDGYLLKNFVEMGVPCLGIEPTASTAEAANNVGVTTLQEFFGEELARQLVLEGKSSDLIIGNNVFAHVPDINDFTSGISCLLKPQGTVTLEFPHLRELIKYDQFDTVYHEHFSYLSLTAVKSIFEKAGLRIYDVQKLKTHGGSLRIFGCRQDANLITTSAVKEILSLEQSEGFLDVEMYRRFQCRANKVKNEFLSFLIEQQKLGKTVGAYGAAAKGNTMLNYAGVKPDLLPFVCDAAPAKQGKFMPGSHIPIMHPDYLSEVKPDYVFILPWNLATEVSQQLIEIRDWGCKFVTAVPELKIF